LRSNGTYSKDLLAMKKLFAVFFLFSVATEAVNAQRAPRYNRDAYQLEAADQRVIKELQREILEGVQQGRLSRQLNARDAKMILKEYRKISSREVKLYRKRKINERKLAQIKYDLDNLIQDLYATIRFEGSGWVRARKI